MLFLLGMHITCGFIALTAALAAMLSQKGEGKHRKFGIIFFYAMSGIFITAIPLSLIIKSLFLFLIALFSYYLAFSGWRYAKNRQGIPTKLDLLIAALMLCVSVIMIGYGIFNFKMHEDPAVILLVFGSIGCIFSYSDLTTLRNHKGIGKQRIINHFSAMLGATIAAVTAFSVTNIPFKPQIILWLGPTVLLTPVIIWWKMKVLKSRTG